MRIERLTVENFLGVRSACIEMTTAVTLIAGGNAAGKSSIRDGLALALTGDLGRVHLKKEAGQLVHHDQIAGYVEVTNADGDLWGVTITAAGKITDTQKRSEPDPVFPYVLDAQRFARLSETERRKFLFDLMGVKMAPAEIKTRLIDRLCPKGCSGAEMIRIDRVLPLLRAGFESASKEAKERATTAKGAWRATTGETYGAVKAASWKATVPPFDEKALAAAAKQLSAIEADIGAVQTQIGELTAAQRAHTEQLARVESLKEAAGKLERIKAKLTRDEEELANWGVEVVRLRGLAGTGPRVGLVHDLAKAIHDLLPVTLETPEEFAANSALDAYETAHGKLDAAGDPEAAAAIPAAERSLDLYSKSVESDKRDQAAAERAAEDLKTIEASSWSAAPLTAAQEHLAKLQADKKTQAAAVDALRTAKLAAEGAAKKTAEAAAHHADAAAWDAIGDALSPDGIPADLLTEAIKPINDRLEQSAADAEWLQVVIEPDMRVTSAGRPYALLSESEKWRVDAMVAEAIGHLSGARLLVLDRMDVLDPAGRVDLFAWLDVLATNGEIDTALVFGTLKALPAELPATVSGHWIENGVVANPQLLKEAA